MMVTLSSDAQGHLDRYLRQVKAALRGHPAVDVSEVEHDVLGHIDAELAGVPEPVSSSSLRAVLDRLGTPDRWVPSEDLPWWRRAFNVLHSGPEDWRLAYLTFASFIAGFWWPPFFIASLPMARATLAQVEARGESAGPRRWLIHPPLALWYVALALGVVIAPISPAVVGLEELVRDGRLAELIPVPTWVAVAAVAAVVAGIWWVIVGLLVARFAATVRVVFWPFADWFERRHALRLAVVGLALFAVGAAIMVVARF